MALAALFVTIVTAAPPAAFTERLSEKDRDKAQAMINAMRKSQLGPYSGISWFCNDGTEQPPKLNGCVEHGGGKMYAVLGPDATRLAKMGIYVGTVLAAMKPEDLKPSDHYRARALVVERYLERALNGWALESAAKTFRGFRQDEDEGEAARALLISLAGERSFINEQRALLVRLMRALPYGRGAEALADQIRSLAGEIGDAERSFANLRFKIHALPEPADADAVEAWAATRTDAMGQKARELAAAIRAYYHPGMRVARLKEVKKWLVWKQMKDGIQAFVDTDPQDTRALLESGISLMATAAGLLRPAAAGDTRVAERNLLLLHVIGLVEELWLGMTAELARAPASREELLNTAAQLTRAAAFAGTLSKREQETVQAILDGMRSGNRDAYVRGARRLSRVLEWARGRVLADIGVPLRRYEDVEPRAAAVVDDILRSGVLLPLAAVLDRLAADAAAQEGGKHRLIGLGSAEGSVRGENPGLAVGPLHIAQAGADTASLPRDAIALLYELPPDLPPVAGIVVVGGVGSLSHVAMLARNLGIPLAAVDGKVAQALAPQAGKPVLLAVSQGRHVALGPTAALCDGDRAMVMGDKTPSAAPTAPTAPTASTSLTIDDKALDLATSRILRLDEVSEADAGVRVGPKAAELGRLRRLFPGRVSDAAVIPFGAFLRHVDAADPSGAPSPLARLRAAYARLGPSLHDPATEAAAEQEMLGELAAFRDAIMKRPFPPGFEAEVLAALKSLGPLGTFGVFVRSDTNVEDLKDFTGAGLNLTVPNRVAVRDTLQAIREVWASPYSERSYRWRQRLLTNPEHVYPSVLLHKTVPSELSGVIVTTDVEGETPGAITVSVSEGVAAVVDGGMPETFVLEPGGGMRLLSSARTPTRKAIPRPPAQGVVVESASGRDVLLDAAAINEVQSLAAEVRERVPPSAALVPWDVEFGLVKGKAFLMQIRPLKLARAPAAHPFLQALDAAKADATAAIDMKQVL